MHKYVRLNVILDEWQSNSTKQTFCVTSNLVSRVCGELDPITTDYPKNRSSERICLPISSDSQSSGEKMTNLWHRERINKDLTFYVVLVTWPSFSFI